MNKRIATYSLAGIAIICLWFFFVYAPAEQVKADTHALIDEATKQLDDYSRTMEELPNYLRQVKDLQAFKDQLNSSLYAKEDILELFTKIAEDVSEHKLKFVEITPPVEELLQLNRANPNTDQPQFLNLSLHLEGQYADFGKYITQLESSPYFRSITSCYIRGRRDIDQKVTMSVSFKAIIGFWGESV